MQKADLFLRNLKREKFKVTTFLILLTLVLTQIPYFIVTKISSTCDN